MTMFQKIIKPLNYLTYAVPNSRSSNYLPLTAGITNMINIFRKFSYNDQKKSYAEESPVDLHYRIVMVKKQPGRVSWRNCTGSFVTIGQSICDIIQDKDTIKTITSPTKGIIANRFVEEGDYILENSLICLIKVQEKPKKLIDTDVYLFKRKLYNTIKDSSEEEVNEGIDKIMPSLKNIQAKHFIPLRQDAISDEDIKDDHMESQLSDAKQALKELPGILDKRRKEQYEKYISQNIREEIRAVSERDRTTFSSSIDDPATKKGNGEFYKQILNENFSSIIENKLHTLHDGVRNQLLVAFAEIDLTNLINLAFIENERSNLKFELKCLIIKGAVNILKKLPYFINSMKHNTKDNDINVRVGIAAGGKLAFPLIENVDKMSYFNLKRKLISLERSLAEGKEIEKVNDKTVDEMLAVTNEWDYGTITGSSCLYTSNYATLALNNVIVKPTIAENYQISFQPMITIALTFNNQNIHGQDALLFLNKLKNSLEKLDYF